MDFLRLPATLRRSALSHPHIRALFCRQNSTSAREPSHQHAEQHLPPPLASYLTLSSATLNDYTTSLVPEQPDLGLANAFFTRSAPTVLYTAAHFRSFPPSPFPEVAFLGRSNSGKSSLLNALFGRPKVKPAHVSKRPGRTRTMNGFGIGADLIGAKALGGEDRNEAAWKRFGRGGIIVVDMPGYGSGSREAWGQEALKYLSRRRQLRRTFVLVDSEHGLKRTDIELLTHLVKSGIPHQVVLSKVDKILYPRARMPGPQRLHRGLLELRDVRETVKSTLKQQAGGVGDILCCSSEKSLAAATGRHRSPGIGIDELRFAVWSACGMGQVGTVESQPLDESDLDTS